MNGSARIQEARCPQCGTWSVVVWTDEIPPGGWWWRDGAACPECGYLALVESECEFRGFNPREEE